MILNLLFILLLFSHLTLAQRAEVTILDPNIDGRSLERSYNVHRGSTHQSSLPDRNVREDLFRHMPELQHWDELKKDMLFMDLGRHSASKIKQKYPSLSDREIQTLMELRKR